MSEALLDTYVRLRTTQVNPLEYPTEKFEHYSIPNLDETGNSRVELGSMIESGKFLLGGPAVLVSKLNPRKMRVFSFHGSSNQRAVASTEFMVFEARHDAAVDLGFLAHLLNGETFARRLQSVATGTTNSHVRVRPNETLRWRVQVPPLEEQRRIAEILDTIDETIQATERVIAKLWLAHHGVVRAILRDCDDGRRVSLREVAEVSGGLSISSSRPVVDPVEVPYLRVANVQDGFIDTSTMRTVSVSRADIDRFSVKAGDVLMNEGGDFDKLGRGAVWDGSISPCLHQNHVFRVRCKLGEMVPEFLALFCQSAEGKAYFVKSSKQTTNLASINKSQLGSLPTLAPSIEAQVKVVETQRASVSKIEAERFSLSKLSRTRAGLAADLLSGRVRTVAS